MYKKYLNCYSTLLISLLSITLGILLLTLNIKLLFLVIYLISIILIIYAASNLLKLITKKYQKEKKIGIIIQILLNTIIPIIFVIIPNIPLSIFSIIFGLYILFNATVKLINYIILKKNKVRGRLIELIIFIFYLVFGLSCIFLPLVRLDTIITIISIYFILLGISQFTDFIFQVIPKHKKDNLKTKIKITLPVFLSVLIPHSILQEINKDIEIEYKNKKNISKDDKPDIEIFIHVTKDGFGAMGHADLYFDNEIISYGNYDYHSIRVFESIGDGVLFTTPNKEKYMEFCQKNSKKTLFGFGLKLTDKQIKAVRNKIKKIKENTYEWNMPSILAQEKPSKKDFYAVRLYRETQPQFYKFKSGKFKTYFVLGTNCVLLVDSILGASGIDILKINGIITPGTYYDYLATEYIKKNSNVISYTIYK